VRRIKIIGLLLVCVAALVCAQTFYCPPQGCALPGAWQFNQLKNRTALPQAADFDGRVTLAALLQPGGDRARWSEARAAAIEGYVVAVTEAGSEGANCYSLTRRDAHIEVALSPAAPPHQRLVVEVTPRLRDWAQAQGQDWSAATLRRELTGRRCRFEGWLLFDDRHAGEAENTMPGRAQNWRATAWELHPMTAIKVLS
jgi:hypothetical protein